MGGVVLGDQRQLRLAQGLGCVMFGVLGHVRESPGHQRHGGGGRHFPMAGQHGMGPRIEEGIGKALQRAAAKALAAAGAGVAGRQHHQVGVDLQARDLAGGQKTVGAGGGGRGGGR